MTSHASVTTLPALDADEQAHSACAAEHIRGVIRARGGVIGFGAFMHEALYAPGLGYYTAGATKLGAAGDFVTAPEVSSLFSRCLARQAAEVLGSTGGDVLELGAGTGRMAADVLTELAALGVLPARYRILEVSPDLAARQRQRLGALPPDLARRVEWLDAWPREGFRGVVLANEVLDALPVDRFVWRGGRAAGLGVGLSSDGAFEWREYADDALAAAAATLAREDWEEGYEGEVCLALDPWLGELATRLEQGVALFIDYGLPRRELYHPQRSRGTLRCHFRHRAHDDPFLNVGLQDITSWVDFTRVAEAGDAAGLEVLGFNTQAAFLLGAGLDGILTTEMQGADAVRQARLAGEARRLVMPEEMGEVFKVLALGRGVESALRGFAMRDLRRSLG
jgi:SAM-dependent MidA family methyltransferase